MTLKKVSSRIKNTKSKMFFFFRKVTFIKKPNKKQDECVKKMTLKIIKIVLLTTTLRAVFKKMSFLQFDVINYFNKS
jgi:hypothetical protein